MPKTPARKQVAKRRDIGGRPRVFDLRVKNFRALRDVSLQDLTPITVLLGANGSGKSTLFDVLNFLSECFQIGVRPAWDRRGRMRELRSRGSSGPIEIQLGYRESDDSPKITYHLAIDEQRGQPVVAEEWLRWKRQSYGAPFRFLDYKLGNGIVARGDQPDASTTRVTTPLRAPDLLAVNTLGQLADHPRVAALREFISDWYVSYLTVEETRGQPEAGPQERLSKSGDNLANVLQFLREQHPDVLERLFRRLAQAVPRLEKIITEIMPDGRLLLQVKDAPFEHPVLARFASDGTLKMLAYYVVLYDPDISRFIGIEEPENFLHHTLLLPLAEELREASARSQLLVTTHSPLLLDAFRPQEVRVLERGDDGFTRVQRVSDLPHIATFIDAGAQLGQLWTERRFGTP